MAIDTIDVADALACAVDDSTYHTDKTDVFLSAGAALAKTGAFLTVVVTTPADTPDEEATHRHFRFWGEEVL